MPTRHTSKSRVTLDRSTNPANLQNQGYGYSSSGLNTAIPKRPQEQKSEKGGRRKLGATTPSSRASSKSKGMSRSQRLAQQFNNRGEVPPEPTPRYLVNPSLETERAYSSAGLPPSTSPRPTTVQSRSGSRARSPGKGGDDDDTGLRLHELEQPTFVVGNAILNPYVPVAPSVQQLVQIVPTLLHLPDSAIRQPLGGTLKNPPTPPPASAKNRPLQSIPSSHAMPKGGEIAGVTPAAGITAAPAARDADGTSEAADPSSISAAAPQNANQVRRLFPASAKPHERDDDDDDALEEDEEDSSLVMNNEQRRLSHNASADSTGRRSSKVVIVSEGDVDAKEASGKNQCQVAEDVIPGLDGVTIAPGTQLLCIEEVLGQTTTIGAVTVEGEKEDSLTFPVEVRPSVLRLQQLYNTTSNDIAVVHGVRGTAPDFVAAEVLPVLRRAEERVAELAAARRLVDWDVTIPTAETIPPPAIAFLDENGAPVHNTPSVVFTLDSQTLRLTREEAGVNAQLSNTATASAPSSARKVNNNAQSIGKHITYEDGVHRIHGLVGIMIGLAEKVGLDRVMEYEVQTTSQELFVAAPYIDSEVGDLVLQMNSTIQGTIKLVVVGHDCGSVDPETLEVQKSVNQLECVIKVQYAHDVANRPAPVAPEQQQQQQQMNPTSGGVVREEEDGKTSFVFAATNPHELRYEECRQATREFLAQKTMQQERDKQLSQFPPGGMPGAGNGVIGGQSANSTMDMSASSPAGISLSGGIAAAVAASVIDPLHGSSNNTARESPAAVAEQLENLQRLPESIGPCEPMTTSIAFHLGSFHHLLSFFRLPAWQNQLSCLLQKGSRPTSSSVGVESNGEAELRIPERATMALFRGPKSYAMRKAFIEHAKTTLGSGVCGQQLISELPVSVELRPSNNAQLVTTEKNLLLLRDLIVTVALESPRPRKFQFHEVVTLSHRLFHSAILRTTISTKGTVDGLQQVAQWAIIPEAERPAASWRCPIFPDGRLTLSEKERSNLDLLADACTVGMSACFSVGAYSEAIFFATQRVYTLCLVHDGTDAEVCYAQRQLAELYMFYGDYAAAHQVALDVVALSEKLYDVDAPELMEAQILSALCLLSANQVDMGVAQLHELFGHILRRSPHVPQLLACVIQLFVVYAQSTCALFRDYFPQLVLENPIPYIDAVIGAIGGSDYLPESSSPENSRKSGGGKGSSQKNAVHLRDFLASRPGSRNQKKWVQKLFCGKSSTSETKERADGEVGGEDDAEEESEISNTVARVHASLLALCGILLIRCGAHFRGVQLLGNAVKDLKWASMPPPPPTAELVQSRKSDDPVLETNPPTPNGDHKSASYAEEHGDAAGKEENSIADPSSTANVEGDGSGAGAETAEKLPSATSADQEGEDSVLKENISADIKEGSLIKEGSESKHQENAAETEKVPGSSDSVKEDIPSLDDTAKGVPQPQKPAEKNLAFAEPFNDNDPFGHCDRLLTLAMAQLSIWRMWSKPSSLQESTERLRQIAERIEKSWGPIHPFNAIVHLVLAQALQNSPHSHALSIARRSLVLLKRCVSSRSWYFLLAHRTLSRLHTLVHHWKDALEHTNAAMLLAQLNYCTDDVMSQVEEDFMGCLLRCPPGTVVRLDHVRLLTRLQERIAHLESIHGLHSEILVWPLVNLAEAYYMLRDLDAALGCLQRAVRLADPKGSLFVTTATLKPACSLPSKEEVKRRNLMISSVLQTRDRILQLAQVLFTMAAILEAMGTTSDAQDCYSRCLALLEAAAVESSLSAIRVYTAVAKLLYSSHEYGDSLGWARKADRLTHSHYPEWLQESQITRSLLAIVEHRLYTEEGTYVTVNPHNHFDDFVELI